MSKTQKIPPEIYEALLAVDHAYDAVSAVARKVETVEAQLRTEEARHRVAVAQEEEKHIRETKFPRDELARLRPLLAEKKATLQTAQQEQNKRIEMMAAQTAR